MTLRTRFDNLPKNSVICPWVGRSYHGAYLGAFYDSDGKCWMAEGRKEGRVIVFDEWYADEQDMLEWSRVGRVGRVLASLIILGLGVAMWVAWSWLLHKLFTN